MSIQQKKDYGLFAGIIFLLAVLFFSFATPKQVQSQFAGQRTWGGTSSGTANAQTIALDNYQLDVGVPITFIVGPGLTNTDATTMNVNSTGVKALRRSTNMGVFEMVGGELVVGSPITIVYDGTIYKQLGIIYQVGVATEFRNTALPQGYAYEDGVCYSSTSTKYAALFSAVGNTYGACGAFTFRVPDSRGRLTAAVDAQGAAGAANQLTTGLNGCNAVIGVNCFAPTSTIAIAQMPVHSVTGNVAFTPAGTINISDPGHTHTITTLTDGTGMRNTFMDTQGGGVVNLVMNFTTGSGITLITHNDTTGLNSGNVTFAGNGMNPGFTSNSVGSGSPIFPFAPASIVYRAVKL